MSADGALYVWAMLDQARDDKHPYGEHTAEIFAQHLISDGPITKDTWKQAGALLYKIIQQYCKVTSTKAFVNGREIGEWMNDFELLHSCEVRIDNGRSGDKEESQGICLSLGKNCCRS